MLQRRREEKLFTAIFDAHRMAVHAYFLGRIGDRESAADLLQDTFLRVWRRLPEVSGLDHARQRAWIFTVARNLAIDTYRSRATRIATAAAVRERASRYAAPADDPVAVAESAELQAEVEVAIRRLPEDQRVVLALQVAGGLTSAEIGGLLGVPAGTVRYRINQARQALAKDLDLARRDQR